MTVKINKTPLKALFYIAFSAVFFTFSVFFTAIFLLDFKAIVGTVVIKDTVISFENSICRRIYYENYTNQRWGDRENYDLMLNSGDLGIEKCVELICQAAK